MTQILNRALPFVLTFMFGIACTAIVRSVLPTNRKKFQMGGRPRCQEKLRKDFPTRRFIPVTKEGPIFNVIEMLDSATIVSSPVILSSDSLRHESALTLKEQALVTNAKRSEFSPGISMIISYVSPDNIDGEPVTSDALISNIPRPRFWDDEQRRRAIDCNAIVRVNLDSSGSIPGVEKVSGYADACPHIGDILDAARDISFRPAMRDGIPVSQRISILYRLN
jgi:hypothetical protein